LWVLAVGTVFVAYICWSLVALVYDSYRFKEVSYGLIPVPLAIPQAVMTAGAVALLIALVDEFVITWRSGRPSFRSGEDTVLGMREG